MRAVPHHGPVHLLIDSSGLSAYGEGEWAAAKHRVKGRRGWRKLHLSVDIRGMILTQRLTEATADDGAYDTTAFYEAACKTRSACRGAANNSDNGSRKTRARASPRNRTIEPLQEIRRRAWKKDAGYHQQARAENAFFRYKTIVGDRLRARGEAGRKVEALIACDILNRMTALGRPVSVAIGA